MCFIFCLVGVAKEAEGRQFKNHEGWILPVFQSSCFDSSVFLHVHVYCSVYHWHACELGCIFQSMDFSLPPRQIHMVGFFAEQIIEKPPAFGRGMHDKKKSTINLKNSAPTWNLSPKKSSTSIALHLDGISLGVGAQASSRHDSLPHTLGLFPNISLH